MFVLKCHNSKCLIYFQLPPFENNHERDKPENIPETEYIDDSTLEEEEKLESSETEITKVIPHLTPPKNQLASVENQKPASTKKSDPTIPSPFKRILFWPEEKPPSNKKVKREKIPSVITSAQALTYLKKKRK